MPQLYPLALYGGISSGGGGGSSSFRTAYTLDPAPDGATLIFTVQGTIGSPVPSEIDLFNNGQWQNPTVDYTLDGSGSQFVVTFTTAPAAGDTLAGVY